MVEPFAMMSPPTLLDPLATTCRPATGLVSIKGCGSVLWPLVGGLFKQGALPRICTGFALWLVKDSNWGRLDSDSASAPKSSSGVEGVIALRPVPVMGTAKFVSLSALEGLITVSK